MAEAFFLPDGERLVSTELTRGPWDAGAQHAGPPAAALARAVERCGNGEAMQVARITLEILRPVPIAPLAAEARVARPGRNVELVEARLTLAEDGDEIMRGAAWRLRRTEVELPELPREPPPPGPEAGEPRPFFATGQDVGYHTAMEVRFVSGGFREPGPATVWMRPRVPLVAGEETTPLGRVLIAADSGNGVSAVLDPRRWLFVNTDLTVHLHRHPAGEWVCLDAVTIPEAHGAGIAEATLWDEEGRVGRSAQTLLVAPR